MISDGRGLSKEGVCVVGGLVFSRMRSRLFDEALRGKVIRRGRICSVVSVLVVTVKHR